MTATIGVAGLLSAGHDGRVRRREQAGFTPTDSERMPSPASPAKGVAILS
ncbi:hypothetical protein [Nitratidesulfovibrio vulgaris]|nr:hypothetical protein [Nitratidesulfovibrio vulgaris]